jgi:hypothetical protein
VKRNNPVCIHCGRQISKDSLKRGDGRILDQVNGERRGEHVVPGCAEKSLKEIRTMYEEALGKIE